MTLSVGIPARDLSKEAGGTKTYIENLLYSLDSLYSETRAELSILHNDKNYRNHFDNINDTYVDTDNTVLFDYVKVPQWAYSYNFDVVLCPKNVVPFGIKAPTVVTVHDLGYFKDFKAYEWLDTRYMKTMIPSSARRADAVIAVSKNTKNDVVKHLGVPSDKVSVVYEAPPPAFEHPPEREQIERIKQEYKISNDFFLLPGGTEQRKNIKTLLKAFDMAAVGEAELIITGPSFASKELEKMAEERPKVRMIGYVPQEVLKVLYAEAVALTYPTLYEGFGLPPLEAMAMGTPVIASDVSSIPEVVGDSGLLVDPHDEGEISGAMEQIYTNLDLREVLQKRGQERVSSFSWLKAADQTLSILKEVADYE